MDLVLSTSVYEHLDDVDGITQALAKLTAPDGAQLHFVDLRDHYFKYPFEMLKFSEAVWRNFLNPTSNLNRFRLPDYRRIFEKLFTIDCHILSHFLYKGRLLLGIKEIALIIIEKYLKNKN